MAGSASYDVVVAGGGIAGSVLGGVLTRASCVEVLAIQRCENRAPVDTHFWGEDAVEGQAEIGYLHQRFQDSAFAWVATQEATTPRILSKWAFGRDCQSAATLYGDQGRMV